MAKPTKAKQEKSTTTSTKKEEASKEVKEKVSLTKVKNRTNQKQVVAYKGEVLEFLAGETKELPIEPNLAKEKFSVFLEKNVLIITN